MTFYTPGTYTAGDVLSAAKLNRDIYNNVMWHYGQFPQRATLYHLQSTVTNGNAITGAMDTAQSKMTYFYQDVAAIDDQFTQLVRLAAGLYRLKFTGQQFAGGGIFDVMIGDSSVGDGFDTYSAATVRNVDLLGGTGYIEIVRPAVYTMTVTVYGKHASSSGYGLRITTMAFIPAGNDT